MDQKYLQEVQKLTASWHEVLNKQESQHRQDASCNVFHFIQDGLYGVEERWKAEAKQRQSSLQANLPIKQDFFEFALAFYQCQVAEQMADVARLMIRKTEEGFDKRWLGLVETANRVGVCDDDSNRNVALGFLVNEEVKLRRGEYFSPLYFWLRNNNEQEKAQLHLNAFVRCHLVLTPGHDLWKAVKYSDPSEDPSTALLLELRSELAEPLIDLSPLALKKLPGQTALSIRKRLLPETHSTSTPKEDSFTDPKEDSFTDEPALSFYNSERISEAVRSSAITWIKEAGLTPSQSEVIYLKLVEGMKLREIAERTGQRMGTVQSHYDRAKKSIKKAKNK